MRIEVIGEATLYLGDCLEIMPTLGKVDAVVTDPPYGVGKKYASNEDCRENAEVGLFAYYIYSTIADLIYVTPGIRNMYLYPAPKWILCWSKPNSMRRNDLGGFNMWEPILMYGKKVIYQDQIVVPAVISEKIDHPCPKPIKLFRWLISKGTNKGNLILDPFMGSGTTGVACGNLGRKFIGIEIESKYFEIACKRIDQAEWQGILFQPQQTNGKQESLLHGSCG